MRVLIFGDSIAHGEYDSQGGWADRLKAFYFERQMASGVDDTEAISLFNVSIPGELVRPLSMRLPRETVARRSAWGRESEFAYVFAVGLNDTFVDDNGRPLSTPQQFMQDLEDLLAVAELFSSRLLFVGLTPVEDGDGRVQNYSCDRIWQFELILRMFVKKHNLPFVGLFEKLRKYNKEEYIFADGLHPNDEGHRLIFDRVRPKLHKLLVSIDNSYTFKDHTPPKNK
jgi:lysophospholipase L1-like esterase